MPRLYVPFGELKSDGNAFVNDGLLQARNVVPLYGNYIASQLWVRQVSFAPFTNELLGLHVHAAGGSSWFIYTGESTKLWELLSDFGTTADKTRLVGGPYAAATNAEGWQGATFGDAIVMTDYVDDPQLLTSPAAANFVKLAQSGGVNPGMDPKAKFVFGLRNNLFLANLNLAAPFDGLPAGANPTTVCWSQSENIRQFGSYNVTPQLIGTGYQPTGYDFGHITGGIGGQEFGLIAYQGGWARIDGPPYTFRPIAAGTGTRYPNSIVSFDRDVFFWGPSGPSVLRGGEGPVEVLGRDKIGRTLIDNTTGFSPTYSIAASTAVRHVSAAIDSANDLLWMSYTSSSASAANGQVGDLSVVYNLSDGRFGFVENGGAAGLTSAYYGVTMLRSRPDLGTAWSPGRDLVGIAHHYTGTPPVAPRVWGVGKPNYGAAGSASPLLERAYQQYDKDLTTRPLRVRPIYSRSSLTSGLAVTVRVSSKSKPYAASIDTTSTSEDTQGWITLPGSVFADFHNIRFTFAGTDLVGYASHGPESITELEGYEVEYAVGGVYSA